MSKALSILIASTRNREHMFNNLMRFLKVQKTSEIEVLASIDNGEKTIGTKRNELLKASVGKYVCLVDDDDMISPYFVNMIVNATKNNSDCIGIKGIITLKNTEPRLFIHTIKCKDWYEDNNVYYRNPNHLNPIKREIALDTMFPDISNQEDRMFSHWIQPKLKTETFIETPLYYYYPSSEQ
jgi:glycosyltransferase involved in cell wall biosynthesis